MGGWMHVSVSEYDWNPQLNASCFLYLSGSFLYLWFQS